MYFKIIILTAIVFAAQAGFSQPSLEKYDVTTVLKEKFTDKSGAPLTGKGVLIGDVDSGIDVFHPMFFFADGGEFQWTDVNGDNHLTVGTDGIDLNQNGKIDPDEIIRYIEIKDETYGMLGSLGSDPRNYNPDFDFLYIDANSNKRRDFGPDAGFDEKTPGYGEQLLIAIDENKNGAVEPGEKLIALKTSKIRSVMQRDGVVRRRGVDLIYTEEDSIGHGTSVAGLIIGGHYGVQKIHGIAPDAEMVFASVRYDYTPRFVRNFPDLVGFLRDEKINILLFEDGEWMWEFMDGSSPEEEMVNQLARDGVTIIGGAGNFTTSNMLIKDTLNANDYAVYKVSAPQFSEGRLNDGIFFSFLWRHPETNLSFVIETPDKKKTDFQAEGNGIVKAGHYNIYYAKEVSPKGTAIVKISCSKQDSGSLTGTWRITVKSSGYALIHAYVVDISQSWAGNTRWVDSPNITDESNVCFPSTADSCIAVGAYVVNFAWFDVMGGLASYSSKGYNITGKLGVDITAPGHTTFTTQKKLGYETFNGTSSAAPHVVGAAALLLQYDPGLTHTQIRQILLNSAVQDNFTGGVPNPDWGYGKLDIEGAIKYLINNVN